MKYAGKLNLFFSIIFYVNILPMDFFSPVSIMTRRPEGKDEFFLQELLLGETTQYIFGRKPKQEDRQNVFNLLLSKWQESYHDEQQEELIQSFNFDRFDIERHMIICDTNNDNLPIGYRIEKLLKYNNRKGILIELWMSSDYVTLDFEHKVAMLKAIRQDSLYSQDKSFCTFYMVANEQDEKNNDIIVSAGFEKVDEKLSPIPAEDSVKYQVNFYKVTLPKVYALNL